MYEQLIEHNNQLRIFREKQEEYLTEKAIHICNLRQSEHKPKIAKYVVEIAKKNGISVTDELAVGQEIDFSERLRTVADEI